LRPAQLSPAGAGIRLADREAPRVKALVLAAGNGDRFVNGTRHSKLLHSVLGQPLIVRTLNTAISAGITSFEIVLGYQAAQLEDLLDAHMGGVDIHFSYNPDWQLENGTSVLAAERNLSGERFALLMGDHLFEPSSLSRLLAAAVERDQCLLGIDRRPAPADVVREATKVALAGSRIIAIGKALPRFDAIDTGMFLCSPTLFDALAASQRTGDTTLSAGIRQLAARGLIDGVDINPAGDAYWFDIDTIADLEAAEARLLTGSRRA
jgi:choline kinase